MMGVIRVSALPDRLRLLDDEGTRGVLLGWRCRGCNEHFFGEVVLCRKCSGRDLESIELGARGTLYSYTIVHVPPPGWKGEVPYVLGQVELPSGPHVLARVMGCQHERLRVGMALDLTTEVATEDDNGTRSMVYAWRPAGDE
jgi:hypothetical protein